VTIEKGIVRIVLTEQETAILEVVLNEAIQSGLVGDYYTLANTLRENLI
jgi:hypothetical protein